ncbi:MAG: purine permease, partial [Alphaproteobacteria bacterium]|nr:purine permease [Alphaproteobacteria bacterium]
MQAETPILHGIEDRPPLGERAVLGAQHMVAMLLGNITPPLLIAGALGLDAATTAVLMQAALVMAGLATLVQAYPIGPVGGRLPVVMGTSIAFVGGFILVGKEHGLAAALGACLAA